MGGGIADAAGEPHRRRPAAVLVPVYRDADGVPRVVLVRRAAGGVHGGQIAFPGGKVEACDASPAAAAVREAEEEIGLDGRAVELLAALTALDTATSHFTISPFLGRVVPRAGGWRRQEREIAEVLDVPVAHFALPETRGEETWVRPGHRSAPRRIAFFHLAGEKLWGATFRILEPLVPRLLDGEWEI